jgi:hypothetical protein
VNIKTIYEYPPIPVPGFWRAYDDDLGADTSPYGQGATEQEAIDDLTTQMEEAE